MISMPGATSTYREAIPATGMNPFAAEATNEASWGWRLSMKTNDRSCTIGPSPFAVSAAADVVALRCSARTRTTRQE